MVPEELYENIDEMIELETRKITLLREFKRALLLADLIGAPPKELSQTVRIWVRDTGPASSYNPRPWLHKSLVVVVGGDEPQEFALRGVPHELWPDDLRRAYGRWEAHRTRNISKE